jgi:hypothetical protein
MKKKSSKVTASPLDIVKDRDTREGEDQEDAGDEGAFLFLYGIGESGVEGKEAEDVIDLSLCTSIQPAARRPGSSNKDAFAFDVYVDGKSVHFVAESSTAMEAWLEVLEEAVPE